MIRGAMNKPLRLLMLVAWMTLLPDLSRGQAGAAVDVRATSEKLQTFGQFVGSWSFVVKNHLPGGMVRQRTGIWTFRWALDGLGIQDEWRVLDATGTRQKSGVGITIRVYDGVSDSWKVVWVTPRPAVVELFIARRKGTEIVLEGVDAVGGRDRWTFFHIQKRAFDWRAESSPDGKVWTLGQEISARRIAS